jgi:hypothetical protein
MDVSEQCGHSLEQQVRYLICNGCIRTMWTFSGATCIISYIVTGTCVEQYHKTIQKRGKNGSTTVDSHG